MPSYRLYSSVGRYRYFTATCDGGNDTSQLTMIYEIGKTRFKRRNTDKLLTIKTYNIFQRYLIAIIIYLAPIIW